MYVQNKIAANKERHEERHRRRKEEAKDPELRRERLEKNQPASIDKKRVWDDVNDDSLGAVVDVAQLKRRRLEEAEAAAAREADGVGEEDAETDDDADSMLDSDDSDDDEVDDEKEEKKRLQRAQRTPSVAPSTTSTNLDLTPDSLTEEFKHLFADELPPVPKVLVTTSLNATIHKEAQEIAALFPNSTYIRRSAHKYSHKYSVREIAKFAKSKHDYLVIFFYMGAKCDLDRGYTAVVVVMEDLKRPYQLAIIHLNSEEAPLGPTLTYSIRGYQPGKSLLGHGNATNHYVCVLQCSPVAIRWQPHVANGL